MAVVAVLTAVNNSAQYLECVKLYEKAWEKINFESPHEWIPIVLRVSDSRITLQFKSSTMEWKVPLENIPTSLIAQVSRVLVPSFVETDYVITTDVDMLPLNLRVLEKSIDELDKSRADFIVCRDVLKEGQFPICYNVASPEIWGRMFPKDLTSEILEIWNSNQLDFDGRRGKKGWYFDQEYLFEKIVQSEKNGIRVKKFKDKETLHRRLDVNRRAKILWPLIAINTIRGSYTDFHLNLPIGKHRIFIGFVLFLSHTRSYLKKLNS
jgi:hypothetical protein